MDFYGAGGENNGLLLFLPRPFTRHLKNQEK